MKILIVYGKSNCKISHLSWPIVTCQKLKGLGYVTWKIYTLTLGQLEFFKFSTFMKTVILSTHS